MSELYKATIIKTLIEHHKDSERLMSFFSKSLIDQIHHAPFLSGSPIENSSSLDMALERIHPSWVLPFFETLSGNDQMIFLGALPNPLQQHIKEQMHISPVEIGDSLKPFFQKKMLSFLRGTQTVFDCSVLPEHPLNILTTLSFDQLHQLIKILGLFDLAIELKTIIQKTIIKKIEETLSKEELKLLKKFSQKKNLIRFTPLKLANFSGDAADLSHVIFQRGINRLSKALFHASDSLLWHLTHHLEMQHAKAFQAFRTKIKDASLETLLIEEILECFHLLKEFHL